MITIWPKPLKADFSPSSVADFVFRREYAVHIFPEGNLLKKLPLRGCT